METANVLNFVKMPVGNKKTVATKMLLLTFGEIVNDLKTYALEVPIAIQAMHV